MNLEKTKATVAGCGAESFMSANVRQEKEPQGAGSDGQQLAGEPHIGNAVLGKLLVSVFRKYWNG
jgi:hypothetical protein